MIDSELNLISGLIVRSAFQVHRNLGPGLLEKIYEVCLLHEIRKRGLQVESQVWLPVEYDGLRLDAALRLDVVVEGRVLIELKTVERVLPVHEAQILSYLRISGLKIGLLLNFKTQLMKEGIRRFIL
ncbi:MAG: GxxExxY protein [Candidatus Delongbacteria bacterium]